LWLGWLGAAGLSILANFQVKDYPHPAYSTEYQEQETKKNHENKNIKNVIKNKKSSLVH
jgi:hypothetical protein